jgi:hypothetical protein
VLGDYKKPNLPKLTPHNVAAFVAAVIAAMAAGELDGIRGRTMLYGAQVMQSTLRKGEKDHGEGHQTATNRAKARKVKAAKDSQVKT